MRPHPLIAQLAAECARKGLAPAVVAERIGVPEEFLALWGRGAYTPGTDRFLAYADAAGMVVVLRTGHHCLHCGTPTTPSPGMLITDTRALGAELRRFRLTLNLSQQRAAALSGVNPRTVENYEHGKASRLPSIDAYVTGLGCSLSLEPIPQAVAS